MDKISVIVPCYNVEKYIDRCMKSIINQTIGIENLEIILINDASTDHTYQELLRWEKQYSEQILVINFEKNSRQGTARNIGMQYATGEYIAFLDADDWIEPTMYEVLLSAIKSGDYDLAQGGVLTDDKEIYLTPETRRVASDFVINIASTEERKRLIIQEILSCYPFNKLYRKSFLVDNHIVFLENLTYEDGFFLGLLNLYVKSAICVGEYVYHYFRNINGITKSKNAAHHLDFFEVGLRRLLEYKCRKIFAEYKDELEYEYIEHCYLAGMRRLIWNMDKVPYSDFQRIQEQVRWAVPDYRKNPYVEKDEVKSLLLDLLDIEVPEEVWEKIEKALHDVWDI